MKLYYIQYEDGGKTVTEAFSSRRDAEKKIGMMRKDYKVLKTAWTKYIISGKKANAERPADPVQPPETIKEQEFDISKEGLLKAFEAGTKIV